MAIELKQVIEFLGYNPEEIKELSDLKTKFDTEFVRTSNITADYEPVKKILGKTLGITETKLQKYSKTNELDIDFYSEDLVKLPFSDKVDLVFTKLNEKNKAIVLDLTAKAGQGNDEKVKEIQLKLEKTTQKAKDYETLLNSTKTEFESYKTNTATEIKNKTLSGIKKEIYSKAKFLPDTNDFTKKGFLNTFEEMYNFDLDENEAPVITDKKGQKIPSTKVTGAFKTPQELLEEELIKAKLFPLNPDGGQKKPAPIFNQQNTAQANKSTRTVAKRME